MKPKIEQTTFGSITIKGEVYEHDVNIRLNVEVENWLACFTSLVD
jgi:hypothetical protein